MCEYSLELYAVMDAEQGATYTLQRFPSGTKGFAAPKGKILADGREALCACVPPGTLMGLEMPDGKHEVAIFTKLDAPNGFYHRDGFILSGSKTMTLQDASFPEGTKATVFVLGTKDAPEDKDLASQAPPSAPQPIWQRFVDFVV